MAAGDGGLDLALELAADPGGVGGLAEEVAVAGGPFFLGVEEGDVGVGAGLQGAFLEAEDFGGAVGEEGEGAGEGEALGEVELPQDDAQGGLQADDAEGGVVELDVFLVVGVRGVAGGDAVDGAVFQRIQDGDTIFLGAEGRVHLEVGVEALDFVVGEGEVVGGGFGGDVDAAGLGTADDVDGGAGADVLEVDMGASVG